MRTVQDFNFVYLNRDNHWGGFHLKRLTQGSDGSLRLQSLPRLEGDPPEDLASIPNPEGPAGITVGPDGAIFFTVPAENQLLRIDPCDKERKSIPCLGWEDDRGRPRFKEPRGLLFHKLRHALFIVDSGHHRIEILHPETFQILDVWGHLGEETGAFNYPTSIASDHVGNVYVVDANNRRVQQFDLTGKVIAAFWEKVRQSTPGQSSISQPTAVATGMDGDTETIYILDSDAPGVVVVDRMGQYVKSFALRFQNGQPLQKPIGFDVGRDALYVGDATSRYIYKFDLEGHLVGKAIGYYGPAAALLIAEPDSLLVHLGTEHAPVRLALHGGYVSSGFLWGGPFHNRSAGREQWHWLRSQNEPLGADAHLQFFVCSSESQIQPVGWSAPPDPPWQGSVADLADCLTLKMDAEKCRNQWLRVPRNVTEFVFMGSPLDYVWIGVEFSSEGINSPILAQLRIDFDHKGYIGHLPALYRERRAARALLSRFLTLFESRFAGVESRLTHIQELFDPAAVPAKFLPWLAGWLALYLDENWPEEKKRQTIAKAFEMYARRGTPQGLREAIRLYADVDALIEEPLLHANWWRLPDTSAASPDPSAGSILGFSTGLVSADPQGAVVGTTAVLDRSYLISQQEFGLPLFTDIAHQFTVQVYQGQVPSEHKRKEVEAVIAREKPAHTAHHLCVLRSAMRIGFQARIGMDSIVAGPPLSSRLGGMAIAQTEFVLGGELPGQIGIRSQIGQTTRLGESATET
jgi:phage tail-like protein